MKWAYTLIKHCDMNSQAHTDSFIHKLSTAWTHTGCLLPWCPSMTKRDKQVCSEHILVSLCPPSAQPCPPHFLFITPTRAAQSSSTSAAPIHQWSAITCCCSVIDYFSCADALAHQTLTKWQIRSLCPFMIMSLVFFPHMLVFIQCMFALCYIGSIFHTSKKGEKRGGDELGRGTITLKLSF